MNLNILIILLESRGRFLVFRRERDGKYVLPFHVPLDPDDSSLTAINRYLCTLGWDFAVSSCIGPWGVGLLDAYFHLLQDGAPGWAPDGYSVVWMSQEEMGHSLNEGQFIRPTLVDRALSLYASYAIR